MRIVSARRHLLLLLTFALLVGTVVEEASSRRGILWTVRFLGFAPAESADLGAQASIKRQALEQPAHDWDHAALETTAVEVEAVSDVSQSGYEAGVARPDTTSTLSVRDSAAASQLFEQRTSNAPQRQAPARGFSGTGINPFVLLMLGLVDDAAHGVTPASSAADSNAAMGRVFGAEKDVMTTQKPTVDLGLASDNWADITAGLGGWSFAGGGALGAFNEPSMLAGLPSGSNTHLESWQAGSVMTLGDNVGGPAGNADSMVLPAAVVLDLPTPPAPEGVRTVVAAYYGSSPNAPKGGTALGLDLTDGPALDAAVLNPEPSTLVLLGSGLIGLTHWARKRNRRTGR